MDIMDLVHPIGFCCTICFQVFHLETQLNIHKTQKHPTTKKSEQIQQKSRYHHHRHGQSSSKGHHHPRHGDEEDEGSNQLKRCGEKNDYRDDDECVILENGDTATMTSDEDQPADELKNGKKVLKQNQTETVQNFEKELADEPITPKSGSPKRKVKRESSKSQRIWRHAPSSDEEDDPEYRVRASRQRKLVPKKEIKPKSNGLRSVKTRNRKSVADYAEQYDEDFEEKIVDQDDGTLSILFCKMCQQKIGARSDRIKEHLASKRHQRNARLLKKKL